MAITDETHAKLSNEKTGFETYGPTNTILKETIAGTNLELETGVGIFEGVVGHGTLKTKTLAPKCR